MRILGGLIAFLVHLVVCTASTVCMPEEDIWINVPCKKNVNPSDCDFDSIPVLTVADYDRCGPASLPIYARNYYIAVTGRGFTKQANRDAFNRIDIIPKIMQGTTNSSLEISTLNQTIAMPIGISPTAYQKLAHPDGELATATAAVNAKTVMILSIRSSVLLENVAKIFNGSEGHLWMHIRTLRNRSNLIDIVRRAESHGFEAIVLAVNTRVNTKITCDARNNPSLAKLPIPNIRGAIWEDSLFAPTTFDDIKWLKSMTNLPIVAKGVLRGKDAKKVIKSGASAILVSNDGGIGMDFLPATIDALPEVVNAVENMNPRPDVYLDGGVRTGNDVYKALARGAKMVFLGRPILWGLALGGAEGVEDILRILRREFTEAMLLSGAANPGEINDDTIYPRFPPK